MMQTILFDTGIRYSLLPFTHTRPVADIRCGIMTMRERWEHILQVQTSTLTDSYLQPVYPLYTADDNLLVNGAVFATIQLATAIRELKDGQQLVHDGLLIAARFSNAEIHFNNLDAHARKLTEVYYNAPVEQLRNLADIFSKNDMAIRADYQLLTAGRTSAAVPGNITLVGKDIFLEEGAKIYAGCIINAEAGPVYIGKDAEILEGTMIRGPLAIGEHGVIKMGAKVYGATTIGPGCKVGGELNNVVFFANSNKAHDGYLGNAVIGEWCNLGADTNCSNLKNNYDEVKIWDEHANKSVKTGMTFFGLIMGDHSKCAINTMFNTGTVVGVSCNVFSSGFPEKFVPSFCWGGSDGMTTYELVRALETANRMMGRRGKELSPAEKDMYAHIFETTAKARSLFTRN